jgi:transposase InsO family protein
VLRRPVESEQYTAIRYADRLADAGALASIGTVGDSYDNESRLGESNPRPTHYENRFLRRLWP